MNRLQSKHPSRHAQRGISLFGLVFWAMLIGFFGYVAVVVLPTVNEYYTIQRAVDKVKKAKLRAIREDAN